MIKKLLLVIVLMIVPLTGCAPKTVKVCSTVYPIHYLINQIGGNYVETCSISENIVVQRTQIVDNYQEMLKGADALFYIGGLEPYYEIYVDEIRESGIQMIDLSTNSAIYKFGRYVSINIDGKIVGLEKPYYDSSLFDLVNTYVNDPMIWMDPIAMTSMARTITDKLNDLMPDKAKYFEENFARLEVELARLDAEYQTLKKEYGKISIVTMTPSFGNWQKSYGVSIYPIILSKYGVLPNDEQLAFIKQQIINDGVQYIAVEPNLTPDMIALQEQLATELGLIPIRLNNLSSITKEDIKENKNYQTMMYDNLEILESIAK